MSRYRFLLPVLTLAALAPATQLGARKHEPAPSSFVPAQVAEPTALIAAIQPAHPTLARLAPDADPQVLQLAQAAMKCAQADGIGLDARRLAVIDYRLPSLRPRLWVFDLALNKLLYEEVVAHGQGSGENLPTRFSNDDGSHQSSLGLFFTTQTYEGRNGYSLRMDGLEPGINDKAMERAIVMHGAPYVDAERGKAMGRLGRSWGCPAVRNAVAKRMIDLLKDGQFVFSYYPDTTWLQRSALLKCAASKHSASTALKTAHAAL